MRYFFNVHDGRNIPDDEGCELQDVDAARNLALRACGEMIRDGGPEFWSRDDWRMVVSDEAGSEVLVLRFSALEVLSA